MLLWRLLEAKWWGLAGQVWQWMRMCTRCARGMPGCSMAVTHSLRRTAATLNTPLRLNNPLLLLLLWRWLVWEVGLACVTRCTALWLRQH
jgi:hypothetical protein